MLLNLAVEIGSLASRKGEDPNRPVATAILISVYRDESAKIQAIDNFNLTRDDTPTTSYVVPDDVKDEGDFD